MWTGESNNYKKKDKEINDMMTFYKNTNDQLQEIRQMFR